MQKQTKKKSIQMLSILSNQKKKINKESKYKDQKNSSIKHFPLVEIFHICNLNLHKRNLQKNKKPSIADALGVNKINPQLVQLGFSS